MNSEICIAIIIDNNNQSTNYVYTTERNELNNEEHDYLSRWCR